MPRTVASVTNDNFKVCCWKQYKTLILNVSSLTYGCAKWNILIGENILSRKAMELTVGSSLHLKFLGHWLCGQAEAPWPSNVPPPTIINPLMY